MSLPKRKHPPKGVLESDALPTIVFLTVCTEARRSWLADPSVHEILVSIWRTATYWKIGPGDIARPVPSVALPDSSGGRACHPQLSSEMGVRSSTLRIVFAIAMARSVVGLYLSLNTISYVTG